MQTGLEVYKNKDWINQKIEKYIKEATNYLWKVLAGKNARNVKKRRYLLRRI